MKECKTVNESIKSIHKGSIAPMTFLFRRGRSREKELAKPQAWTPEELANRYLEPLFVYVSRRIASEMEAEDIVAEVFADVCRQIECVPPHSSDPENDATQAYLIGMARRKIALALRKKERRKETEYPEADITPDAAQDLPTRLLSQEAAVMIHKTLDALPELQREILLLKYVDLLSLREIGAVLGRSEKAVSSLLQRARATARKEGNVYFSEISGEEKE
jgi:RNA polymerase sigma-70 factor, ECF subfamily